MAERLVVLSDMWGAKKGLWITSYLGYLQQYFEIVYYDSQELADLDTFSKAPDKISEALAGGGLDRAVAQLLSKETTPSHYLTFCAGGTIAWSAALQGLPIKSLYAISPIWLHRHVQRPEVPVKLVFGEYMENRPSPAWAEDIQVPLEIIPKFGRELYSDEKIIDKVCLELLESITKPRGKMPRKLLSVY
jgi:hypothetical protein